MEVKESEKKLLTKSFLQKIHNRHQIMHGESDNVQKEAMITTLGGIDQILSNLLESNADLNQKQLFSLQNIITNRSQQIQTNDKSSTNIFIEDKRYNYKEKLELKFNDSDILLYSIFNSQTATKIINILNSTITKTVLAMMISTFIILNVLSDTYVLSLDAYYICQSVLMFVIFIYCFGWVMYCNTEAIRLLLKTFELWFKLFYLFVYLVAFAVTKAERRDGIHRDRYPIHLICTEFLFDSVFLGLVMIFDSINIKQANKLIISSFAVAIFANNALYCLQMAFYRSKYEIYEQLTVKIPDFIGVGSITFNYVDIAANSAQILFIFLLKQMISSIRNPKKALVIKSKPLIIYENEKEYKMTVNTLTMWKRVTISFWVFGLLFSVWNVINESMYMNEHGTPIHIVIHTIICLLVFVGICLLSTGKIKFLYMANVIVFVITMIFIVCSFLLKWQTMYVMAPFVGFGFSATYALKVSKFEEFGSPKLTNAEKAGNDNIVIEKDNKYDNIETKMDEIEMQTVNVHKHSQWDIDSVDSIKDEKLILTELQNE